jgi:hypothetical protein
MAVASVFTAANMPAEQPTPCHVPWPDHAWDDPDDDGHQCAGCGIDSVWKCDPAAHKIGEHLRQLGTRAGRIILDDGTVYE